MNLNLDELVKPPVELVHLDGQDINKVVRRLSPDLVKELRGCDGAVCVAGGFIRATIAGEEANDIDLLGDTQDRLEAIMLRLKDKQPGSFIYRTDNALTLVDKSSRRPPVQAITRWLFPTPEETAPSFDFTICQAVIYFKNGRWIGKCHPHFYRDLAAKRLSYTDPVREEEAGGSMLRVLKYYQRGYHIPLSDLASVMARVFHKVDMGKGRGSMPLSGVIAGLLYEVDPLLVVDGVVIDEREDLEAVDSHTASMNDRMASINLTDAVATQPRNTEQNDD